MTAARPGDDLRRLRTRAVVTTPIAIIVTAFCVIPALQLPGWSYLCAGFALISGVWGAWPCHRNLARPYIIQDAFSDRLVSLALLIAMAWSGYQLWLNPNLNITQEWSLVPLLGNHTPLFFWDLITVLTPAALWPKYREARLRRTLAETWQTIAQISLNEATQVTRRDTRRIPAEKVTPGDKLFVGVGERFPADGIIIAGTSTADLSMFTPDSPHQELTRGSCVLAGSVNEDADVTIEATHPLRESTLSALQALLHPQLWQAQGGPGEQPAGQLKVIGLAVTLALAAGAATAQWGAGPAFGVAVCIAILAALSPTSPTSTAPLPLVVAQHQAARKGIYFADRHVLRWTRTITTMVFTRTSTLTQAKQRLTTIDVVPEFDGGEQLALAYAASLEDTVDHPIAHAILAEAKRRKVTIPAAEGFVADPGLGVRGNLMGHRVQLATSSAFGDKTVPVALAKIAIEAAQLGHTCLLMTVSGDVVAAFTLTDEFRPEAIPTLAALSASGYDPLMLTGADRLCAATQSEQLQITSIAELRPAERLSTVVEHENDGELVAVVGQRQLHHELLATGTLSIAVGNPTGMAKHRTHITILDQSLAQIPDALRIAHHTDRSLRATKKWLIGYNILAAAICAAGLIPPAGAAIAMTLVAAVLLRRAAR